MIHMFNMHTSRLRRGITGVAIVDTYTKYTGTITHCPTLKCIKLLLYMYVHVHGLQALDRHFLVYKCLFYWQRALVCMQHVGLQDMNECTTYTHGCVKLEHSHKRKKPSYGVSSALLPHDTAAIEPGVQVNNIF